MLQPSLSQTEQVFVSYSRTDREACVALRSALEQTGLSVFQDEDAIRIGDRWMERLQDALKGCRAFVLLVGHDGVRRWVGAEVQVALGRHLSPHHDGQRLPIFPVLLDGAKPEDLPPFLALFQSARWSPADPVPRDLLDAISERAIHLHQPEPFEGCPFLGLNAFRRKDARLFFGRRKETLEALAYLGDQQQTNPENMALASGANYCRWLQIEGNSGAGKSSLVNAGMLPMIEQGALWARTGFADWTVLGPMMPGKDPLTNLVDVLEQTLIADPTRRDSLARRLRFEQDERALAFALRDLRRERSAFLLVVDQFEELFTFADEASRKHFDASLANALGDPECPLFLLTTVRADFLDRFEQLPRLRAIYNSHCKRYFLLTISEQGLREVIEQPARIAGVDVSEVTTAILEDARDEIGALPLVENALFVLWQHDGKRLSGDYYRRENGIAGMLRTQADALLDRIEAALPKRRVAALELLLRLTRINDEGRHTRQRITREDAVMTAGNGNDALGERVVRMLSGERPPDAPATGHSGALRLITTSTEGPKGAEAGYVDLIHETLIRPRGKDEKSGKRIGYWPTLYEYVEGNRDRDLHRQQLKLQTEQWQGSGWFGRVWNLAGWGSLWRYRRLRLPRRGPERRFLYWSRAKASVQGVLLALLIGVWGESSWWATRNSLPFGYVLVKPLWALGYAPLPKLAKIPAGKFTMGCVQGRDDILEGECSEDELPAHEVTIGQAFFMGAHEVTFLQYDYYVWDRQRDGDKDITYPPDAGFGRFDRPVINVSWDDAKAYTRWLSEKTCRLPTEQEWEYAARGGTETAYRWGKDFGGGDKPAPANCIGGGSQWAGKMTAPVGSFSPNPWGLYDTAGNVWEWSEDEYQRSYAASPGSGPPEKGTTAVSRVLRGGSWDHDPRYCRAAYRNHGGPVGRGDDVGFRVSCASPIE